MDRESIEGGKMVWTAIHEMLQDRWNKRGWEGPHAYHLALLAYKPYRDFREYLQDHPTFNPRELSSIPVDQREWGRKRLTQPGRDDIYVEYFYSDFGDILYAPSRFLPNGMIYLDHGVEGKIYDTLFYLRGDVLQNAKYIEKVLVDHGRGVI